MRYAQRRILHFLFSTALVLAAVAVVVTVVKRRNAGEGENGPSSSASSSEEQTPLSANSSKYGTLTYSNGSATLSFTTDEEGKWYWVDDADFPLDQSCVTQLVNTVSNLSPQQTITDGDGLEAYGLSQPSMTVTAASGSTKPGAPVQSGGGEEKETSTTLYLGNQVSGSNSYYLYIDGDPDTVYVVSDALATQIRRSIYEMMDLPELPEIEESALRAVTVTGPSTPAAEEGGDPTPGKTTTFTAYAGTDSVTWRSGGTDVTDSADVKSVLSLVRSLNVEKCVDYKPSEEAVTLCGFDNPAATVVATYGNASGEEQTLTLYVGGASLDGGSRYIRVNDDETVYSVAAGRVSSLLTIASSASS